jgi:hypothetical protein
MRPLLAGAGICATVFMAFGQLGSAQERTDYWVDPGIAIDMRLEQAVHEAHAIVVGTITASTVRFAPEDPPPGGSRFKKIVTEYTVDVPNVLKDTRGNVTAPLALWLRGGRAVAGRPMPDGEPLLQAGRTYVLMLWWNEHASMYELNNAGESTWELTAGRVRAVGTGRQVKRYAGKRSEQFLARLKRVVDAHAESR